MNKPTEGNTNRISERRRKGEKKKKNERETEWPAQKVSEFEEKNIKREKGKIKFGNAQEETEKGNLWLVSQNGGFTPDYYTVFIRQIYCVQLFSQ